MDDSLHSVLTRHRIHEVECVIPDMSRHGVHRALGGACSPACLNWSKAIDEYVTHHDKAPKPFIWTKSARDILQKVIRANSR